MPIPQLRIVEHRSSQFNKRRNHKLLKRLLKQIFKLGLACAIGLGIYLFGAFVWYSRTLPNPDKIMERNISQSTKIYDRKGETVLYDVHGEQRRTLVKLAEIPDVVKWATLAAEDRDFYNHHGVKITGMIRAVIVNTLKGYKAQGGSTITQQFVKKAILTSEKTYTRKIKEVVLAYQIEKKFSKDEILQMYLNEIPYGSVSYGVESASQTYFAKSARDITLPEAAILAAMIKAPSYYSPFGSHRDELISREQYILDQMAELGYITKDAVEVAKKQELKFAKRNESIIAPHFVLYVKEILAEKLGEEMMESAGLKVITTLDLDKQRMAEEAVKAGVEKRSKQYNFSNAALVSLDSKNGQILAMVGSKDYFGKSEPEGCVSGKNCKFEPNDNVVLRLRQPGSSIKPMIYTAAFEKGYTPNTSLYDVKTVFKTDTKDYNPSNYDGAEHGRVSMRSALAGSLNIPAVKTLYLTGVDRVLNFLELMGYTSFEERSRFGLSLVLGGGEVKPIEHAAAFATLANQGKYNPTTGILRVEDSKGNVLFEFEQHERKALDSNIANTTTNILSDNNARAFIFGAQNFLTLPDRPVAAKTGTTNDFRDAWTAGFTPAITTVVWVGNNDNSAMKKGADGSQIAAPIWKEYMQNALKGTPVESFTSPTIDTTSKPVLDGAMTGEQIFKIDKFTGKLATDLTPASYIIEKKFSDVHCILYYVNKDDPRGPGPGDPNADPAFKNWEAAVQNWYKNQKSAGGSVEFSSEPAPTEYDDVHTEANRPSIFMKSPSNYARITGSIMQASVNVSAPRGISRVEYYLDNKFLISVSSYPYELVYPLNSYFLKGDHRLRAIAYDDVDNSNEASVSVKIDIDVPEPGINWLLPQSGAVFATSDLPIPLKVRLTDPLATKKVTFYQRYLDSGQVNVISAVILPQTAELAVNWDQIFEKGAYQIYAEITDDYNRKIETGSINITIN